MLLKSCLQYIRAWSSSGDDSHEAVFGNVPINKVIVPEDLLGIFVLFVHSYLKECLSQCPLKCNTFSPGYVGEYKTVRVAAVVLSPSSHSRMGFEHWFSLNAKLPHFCCFCILSNDSLMRYVVHDLPCWKQGYWFNDAIRDLVSLFGGILPIFPFSHASLQCHGAKLLPDSCW